MTPPAPALLSTSTCWPSSADSRSASEPRHHVRDAAGREGHDEADRLLGIVGPHGGREREQDGEAPQREVSWAEPTGRVGRPPTHLLRACEAHLPAEQDQRLVDHVGAEVRGHAVHVLRRADRVDVDRDDVEVAEAAQQVDALARRAVRPRSACRRPGATEGSKTSMSKQR